MKTYSKILDIIEKILTVLIAIVFAVMLVSIVYLVFMRYLFHHAPSWCEELARFGFLYLVFLTCPIAIRKGSHLQVDFISSNYPPTVHHIVSILSNLVTIAVLGFLFYQAGKLAMEVTTLSGAMQLPYKYLYGIMPVGCFFMVLYSVEIIVRDILALAGRGNSEEVAK